MLRQLLLLGSLAACLAISASSALAQRALSVVVLETFDFPAPTVGTFPLGINDAAQIVGTGGNRFARSAGYRRSPGGTYSKPIFLDVRPRVYVALDDINNRGIACGYYFQLTYHGFIFDGDTVTTYDYPGGTNTQLHGINDNGDFVGQADTGGGLVGFANLGGESVTINVPRAFYTVPWAINSLGQIAGFSSPSRDRNEGFLRDADGQFTTQLAFPDADLTMIYGLNDQGTMVGSYMVTGGVGREHGFILTLPNQFTPFDVPGSASTTISAINNEGVICGYYASAPDYQVHGFIAQIQ